jgi:hypothetical protein
VIRKTIAGCGNAIAGCYGVLVVLVTRGAHHYASGAAQAVLD